MQVQKRLNELDSSLASYEKLPQTEAEAEELVRDQLHRVELSFFNSCKNASCADAGGPIKDSMILAMDEAAKSYVKKQVRRAALGVHEHEYGSGWHLLKAGHWTSPA